MSKIIAHMYSLIKDSAIRLFGCYALIANRPMTHLEHIFLSFKECWELDSTVSDHWDQPTWSY